MPVCQFFLQGRCRYGEKCWNEHTRGGGGGGGGGGGRGGGGGGRGGGGYNSNNRAPPLQQQPRGGGGAGGGGGFGNRVWVNPSQQRGGYVQPSSFGSRENDQWNRRGDGGGGTDWGRGGGGGGGSDWGRGGGGGGSDWSRGGGGGGGGSDWGRGGGGGGGGTDWGRGGGGGGGGSDWGRGGGGGFGRRENIKSSEYNFSQNRFSALDTPSTFDKGGRAATTTGDDDNDRKCETIQSDMEAWDNSGQWGFSTYSHSKNPLSGFSDLSPEELRLEYYTSRASGNLQNYINGVNQLLSQWRSRVQELKVMNASTRAALIRELNSTAPQDSSKGFGSTDTGSALGSKGFGASDQQSSFSFAAQATGFSSPSVSTSTGFGSAPSAPPPSGFGSAPSAPPPSGFGGAPSAPPPSGFGAPPAPSASAFSFAASDKTSAMTPSGFGSPSSFSFSASTGGGFGTGFGAQPPATTGVSSVFGQPNTSVPASAVPASGASDSLFSSESNLTSEELDQFKAKRFMLGQIPLKPPPANLLSV